MQQCMQLTRTNSSRSYVVRTLLSLCGSQGAGDDVTAVPDRFPVVMARGIHLFPFRTESLSPSAPMVLGGKLPGRVGRRRNYLQKATPQGVAFCRSGPLFAWRRCDGPSAPVLGVRGAGSWATPCGCGWPRARRCASRGSARHAAPAASLDVLPMSLRDGCDEGVRPFRRIDCRSHTNCQPATERYCDKRV